MAYGYKRRPSKTKAREFARKMDEIDTFCRDNGISQSSRGDSYYFNIDGVSYSVSNHSVEANNRVAYDFTEAQVRQLYHEGGRGADTVYIHTSKTGINEICTDLKDGWRLDGRGCRIEKRR